MPTIDKIIEEEIKDIDLAQSNEYLSAHETISVLPHSEVLVPTSIRGGQTGYREGYGWWEGADSNTFKFSIKGTSGNELYFDGTNVYVTGVLNASSGYFGNSTNGVRIDATGLTVIESGYIASTASPASRFQLEGGSGASSYDSNNKKRVDISGKYIDFYNVDASAVGYLMTSDASDGDVSFVATDDIKLTVGTGDYFEVRTGLVSSAVDLSVTDANVYCGDLTVAGAKYLHIKGDDDSDNHPGQIVFYDHAGNDYFMWVDSNGQVRISTAASADQDADGDILLNCEDDYSGNAGKVAVVNAGATAIEFVSNIGTLVRFRAYLSSALSVATGGAGSIVHFDAENYDGGSNFNTTSHRFVAPVAGYYLLTTFLKIDAATTDAAYQVRFEIDGAAQDRNVVYASANTSGIGMAMTDIVYLAASSYVEVWIICRMGTTGSTDDVTGYFAGHKLSE